MKRRAIMKTRGESWKLTWLLFLFSLKHSPQNNVYIYKRKIENRRERKGGFLPPPGGRYVEIADALCFMQPNIWLVVVVFLPPLKLPLLLFLSPWSNTFFHLSHARLWFYDDGNTLDMLSWEFNSFSHTPSIWLDFWGLTKS